MKKTLYGIIQVICAATNDKYKLSKMLYYNVNSKNRNILNYMRSLDYILGVKKNETFDFKEFYDKIMPHDIKTGKKITQKKFIDMIEEKYDIELNLDKNGKCKSNIFDKLIINLDSNSIDSELLNILKNVYIVAINGLDQASNEIIKLMKKQRDKRLQLPQFIRNFQKFHKDNLKE